MGFDFKRKYDQPEDLDRLRYGKLMIMTDQDVDGSHIKGLVINFIHHFWPNMLRTPVVQGTDFSIYDVIESNIT